MQLIKVLTIRNSLSLSCVKSQKFTERALVVETFATERKKEDWRGVQFCDTISIGKAEVKLNELCSVVNDTGLSFVADKKLSNRVTCYLASH